MECRGTAAADPGEEEIPGRNLRHPEGAGIHEQDPAPRAVQPEKATNGLLTLLIRDSCTKNKGDAVVTFGRHRGKLFKEVPRNYLEWAVQEVKQRGPEGSSPDLVSLSTYAAQVLKTVSGEMVAPAGDRVNDLLGGRLEPAHTGGPGHEQRGGLRQPAQGQKLDAGADAKGTDEISIHKEDTRPRRERRVRFSEDEPRCTAGRSSGDGGAYGSIGLVTGQVQHLGHGHPGGYESEGELTDRQQESPDGLMVVSIDHEKQSYSPDDGKFFDCQENAAAEVVGSDVFSAESRAQELLAKRDFSFESCEKVLECVCKLAQSSRKRKINESTCSVAFGAYSHGNHYGIIKKTFEHWHTCRYLNAFMRHHGAEGQWSSLQLGYNCHVGPHRDAHNLHPSLNWAISFGEFSQGRLWLECDPKPEVNDNNLIKETILSDGTRAHGLLHDTRCNMKSFSPKTRHAVEQWTGTRCSIVAYTTRGIGELSRPERDVLRSGGFRLGRSEGSEAWEKEHQTRPKKSMRRSLWKGARRASAMLALGMTTATSYIAEVMPQGKPVDQVTLLEVGGIELTCETIEAGFKTIEPLSWDDYLSHERPLDVHRTLSDLKPRVLWFQGDAVEYGPGTADRIVNTAGCQIGLGGTFVYQAKSCNPFWHYPKLKGLLCEQPHSYQVAGDDQILRVGDLCGDHEAGCNRTQNIDNEAHVASHAEPKGHGEHHGASAIHFDPSVPKHVQSALSRLHQNLGHPKIEDMMRHLRYAGAEEAILKACKKMRCDVCLRNQKTGCARPAVLPSHESIGQCRCVLGV